MLETNDSLNKMETKIWLTIVFEIYVARGRTVYIITTKEAAFTKW